LFTQPPTVEYVGPAAGRRRAGQAVFARYFQASAGTGRPETVLICRGGQAEAKHAVLLPFWPSAETMLLQLGQGVGLTLLRGGKGLSRHSF
jgi:hypothetical protein